LKTLVIGDIHGCYIEMQELIEKAGLNDQDKIIALGDIIDRGPDSISVIDFFIKRENTECVLGNHESKHIKIFNGSLKPSPSQEIEINKMTVDKYKRIIKYFKSLPHFIEFPEALIIHGIFEPDTLFNNQKKNVLVGSMSGESYIMAKYSKPWYEYYNNEKPLIAGHHDYSKKGEPVVYNDKVYLIDTGCCYGKNLTGIILPDYKFVTVGSRKNYWGIEMQNYKKIKRDQNENSDCF
jgi:serine/threonine protein phosphatase 1